MIFLKLLKGLSIVSNGVFRLGNGSKLKNEDHSKAVFVSIF